MKGACHTVLVGSILSRRMSLKHVLQAKLFHERNDA